MPGREGSRCLTRQEQVASYSRALVMTAATATMLRAAVLLRRMSLSRSRVFPGVCSGKVSCPFRIFGRARLLLVVALILP